MLPDMRDDEPKPTENDLRHLRQIHNKERHGVMLSDVQRWRSAGWIAADSWELTPRGLRLIGESPLTFAPIGPDLRPPPPFRPRTPEELAQSCAALRSLSEVLGSLTTCPEALADSRLAWILSVVPLSEPDAICDALSFVSRVLVRTSDPGFYAAQYVQASTMQLRHAALCASNALCALVDAAREEVEDDVTDRRRSVSQTLKEKELWIWEGPVGPHRIRVTVGRWASADWMLSVSHVGSTESVGTDTQRCALAEALGNAVDELLTLRAACSRS